MSGKIWLCSPIIIVFKLCTVNCKCVQLVHRCLLRLFTVYDKEVCKLFNVPSLKHSTVIHYSHIKFYSYSIVTWWGISKLKFSTLNIMDVKGYGMRG